MNNMENVYGIRERFDFGGCDKGTSGPHVQYDFTNQKDKPVKFPRPLGQSTDRVDLGQQKDFCYSIWGDGKDRKIKDI